MGKELRGWRIEIIATDLSTEVLEKARSGIYSQFEVQRGLPALMLIKYFSQIGETWQIAPEIRGMVKFMPLNLLNDFSHLGRFDLVLCRNVLIYFDQPTKIAVLERIAGVTERDGFLVLGGAETVVGLTDRFKPIPDKRGVYGQPGGMADGNVLSFSARPAVSVAAGAGADAGLDDRRVCYGAGNRGSRIDQDAHQGWRRIGEPPVDLLKREHEHRAEGAKHICGERRGERDADLEGIER